MSQFQPILKILIVDNPEGHETAKIISCGG